MQRRPRKGRALQRIQRPRVSRSKDKGEVKQTVNIYRVHVWLRETDPPIWRLLELSSRTTLKQFQRILRIAMGWEVWGIGSASAASAPGSESSRSPISPHSTRTMRGRG